MVSIYVFLVKICHKKEKISWLLITLKSKLRRKLRKSQITLRNPSLISLSQRKAAHQAVVIMKTNLRRNRRPKKRLSSQLN